MGAGLRVLVCHGGPPLCKGPHDSANDGLWLKLRPVGQLRTAWLLRRHKNLHLRERERQEAQILQQPTPSREWVGGGLSDAQIMDTAAVGVAQKEDDEQRIDE